MRILNLNTHGRGVGEYRNWMPSRALLRQGLSVTFFDDSETFAGGLRLIDESKWFERIYSMAKDYDLIHAGYSPNLSMTEALVAIRHNKGVPFITDIDDDILNVPPYNRGFKDYHPAGQGRKISLLQLRVSDGVSSSTQPLTTLLTPNVKKIATLPNCHEHELWEGLEARPGRANDQAVYFMFAGNHGRYGDLAAIGEAFLWAMDKYPNLRLVWVGMVPDWTSDFIKDTKHPEKNRAFVVQPTSIKGYRRALKWIAPDVLFSPVEENVFNKSKSHIKAYDAAESGAAFLCTDFDTYKDVPNNAAIKLSNTTSQWKEGIEALITDRPLRQQLNARLKRWARTEWHIDNHIEKWVTFYRDVAAAGAIQFYEDLVHPTGVSR